MSTTKNLDISYLALRQAIGWIGMTMPWLVRSVAKLWYGIPMLGSISAYYHTPARDLFVGFLWATGIVLFFYRGSDQPSWQDKLLGPLTGLAGALIGVFPMDPNGDAFVHLRCDTQPGCSLNAGPIGYHFVPVAIFFASMIYLTLFRFRRQSHTGTPITEAKQRRNRIYVGCGITMLAACVAIFLLDRMEKSIFVPEAVAIFAFGVAWITKGRGMYRLRAA